ncbi:hypothetical protein B4073_2398 [Bacillus subtilis]|nr:hypothetical protein B4068_2419 [Bacillus subtilis]KIN45706.1 hypothetical protein B4073_2398 [Bacillus subtilis]
MIFWRKTAYTGGIYKKKKPKMLVSIFGFFTLNNLFNNKTPKA